MVFEMRSLQAKPTAIDCHCSNKESISVHQVCSATQCCANTFKLMPQACFRMVETFGHSDTVHVKITTTKLKWTWKSKDIPQSLAARIRGTGISKYQFWHAQKFYRLLGSQANGCKEYGCGTQPKEPSRSSISRPVMWTSTSFWL